MTLSLWVSWAVFFAELYIKMLFSGGRFKGRSLWRTPETTALSSKLEKLENCFIIHRNQFIKWMRQHQPYWWLNVSEGVQPELLNVIRSAEAWAVWRESTWDTHEVFESDKAGLHGAGDALADRCSHQSRPLYCSQEKTCLIYYWLCLVCIISTFNYAGMNHRLVIGSFKWMQRESVRER